MYHLSPQQTGATAWGWRTCLFYIMHCFVWSRAWLVKRYLRTRRSRGSWERWSEKDHHHHHQTARTVITPNNVIPRTIQKKKIDVTTSCSTARQQQWRASSHTDWCSWLTAHFQPKSQGRCMHNEGIAFVIIGLVLVCRCGNWTQFLTLKF